MKRNNYLILASMLLFFLVWFSVYWENQNNEKKLDIGIEQIITEWKILWWNQVLEIKSTTNKSLIQDTLPYAKWEVIVKFKENAVNLNSTQWLSSANSIANSKWFKIKWNNKKANIVLFETEWEKSVEDLILELSKNSDIEYVEPNYIAYTLGISTDDTYKTNMWGLDNTGQDINGNTSTNDADIDWPEAMEVFTGNSDQNITGTIIAVIDTGVWYKHPDLINKMWDGTDCKDYNGNALWGCIHGYDFGAWDVNPLPLNSSHGTHIAGTIAAEMNNSEGVIWINPNGKIMALKVSRGLNDALYTFDIVNAIDFATQNGAKVINASYGSTDFSQTSYDAIERFQAVWWIFATAAWNWNFDGGVDYAWDDHNTEVNVYPCDFDLDNIICTAATDTNDDLADYSDFGSITVDVWAPGGTRAYGAAQIYSTIVAEKSIHLTWNLSETTEWEIPNVFTEWGFATNWWVEYTPQISVDSWLKTEYNASPYSNAVNTYVISDELNIVPGSDSSIGFYVWCDTATGNWDYANFFVTYNWIRYYGDDYNEDSITDYSISILWWTGDYQYVSMDLTAFSKNDMQIGFEWTTDLTGDNNHIWCAFADIKVYWELDGSDGTYGWMNGTSMATPHVAGLASLAYSYRPDLSYNTIVEQIINNGDSLTSLNGKTVSGKRINAYNTLDAITEPVGTISFQEWNTTSITGVTLDLSTDSTLSYSLSWHVANLYTGTINGDTTLDIELTSGWGEKTVGITYTNGIGETNTIYDIITLEELLAVTSIAAWWFHSCYVLDNATVKCWGRNNYGQIWDDTIRRRKTPVAVSGLDDVDTLALWRGHSCALLTDATVECWGRNDLWQLGDTTTVMRKTPVAVNGLTNVTQLVAGYQHNCALIEGGTVKCWGWNKYGQLWNGNKINKTKPVNVNLTGVVELSAWRVHTCALLTDNTVKCWGRNNYGQLWDGTTELSKLPTDVSWLTAVTNINLWWYHSCALLTDDTVKCWGRNNYGQIGDSSNVMRKTPVSVSGLTSVSNITIWHVSSCALLTDDTLKCWGKNNYGQLWNGTLNDSNIPVFVSSLDNVNQIDMWYQHTAVFTETEESKYWWYNKYGQIGDGTTVDRSLPTTIN